MTWFDHGRRAASVLLVVACLLVLPAAAFATFTGTRAAGVVVGTDRLERPTAVTGTYRCVSSSFAEGFDVTVSSFTDSGPAGATYKYTLGRGTSVIKTTTSSTHSASLSSGNVARDGGATQWTVTVQSMLGSWTGPVYTRTVTCASLSNATGTL
jgi:hypothetical protein